MDRFQFSKVITPIHIINHFNLCSLPSLKKETKRTPQPSPTPFLALSPKGSKPQRSSSPSHLRTNRANQKPQPKSKRPSSSKIGLRLRSLSATSTYRLNTINSKNILKSTAKSKKYGSAQSQSKSIKWAGRPISFSKSTSRAPTQ